MIREACGGYLAGTGGGLGPGETHAWVRLKRSGVAGPWQTACTITDESHFRRLGPSKCTQHLIHDAVGHPIRDTAAAGRGRQCAEGGKRRPCPVSGLRPPRRPPRDPERATGCGSGAATRRPPVNDLTIVSPANTVPTSPHAILLHLAKDLLLVMTSARSIQEARLVRTILTDTDSG